MQLRDIASSVVVPHETVPGLWLPMEDSHSSGRLWANRYAAKKRPSMTKTVVREDVTLAMKRSRRCLEVFVAERLHDGTAESSR